MQWVIGLAVPLILGFEYGPTTGFVFVATMIVLIIVGVYILCDLACIGYYLRHRREDFNPLLHVVVPILGIAAFAPALLAAAGIQAFSFIAPLSSPVLVLRDRRRRVAAARVILLAYFASTHPERVAEMSRVHLDEIPVEDVAGASVTDAGVIAFRPAADQFAWTFGGAAPVMRVQPGSVLELWTEDCFAGRVRSRNDLVSVVCQFPFLNPQTGPFYIEGAEPGDTLAVHFISIEPSRDWAASSTVPLFGALTSTHLTATLQDPLPEIVWMWQLDRVKRLCQFEASEGDFTVDLPMVPMHGTVGVAPANLEVRSALVPDAYGGNMDTPEMQAGVTCYLGVNVRARCSRSAMATPGRARARHAGSPSSARWTR